MKKIKLILLLTLWGLTANIFAQQQTLQGIITNTADVEGIHILNTSSHLNTIADKNGNFSIRVKKNDTLLFSSVTFIPEKIVVTEAIYEKGIITVQLEPMVNELSEVVLGPNLSGNLAKDAKDIKTNKSIDFDDVGIPGFKGEPKERIVPVAVAFFPTNVNLEAVYKYLSGYYKNLKKQRKWEAQNTSVAKIIAFYTEGFFTENYKIPQNRLYDFLLFCEETSDIQGNFRNEHYALVLNTFEEKSKVYLDRLEKETE